MEDKKDKYQPIKLLNPLEKLLFKKIQIVTTDGKVLIGVLKGLDQALNSILSDCVERVFSSENNTKAVKHGLYLLRGDNIAVLGEIDEELENQINYDTKIECLKPITN
ncbi:hypothetical protein ABPG74_014157 [Tetrahymena malaccensis]